MRTLAVILETWALLGALAFACFILIKLMAWREAATGRKMEMSPAPFRSLP